MDYTIESMNEENAVHYARVNALSWKQSYKGIVNDDFLELINTETEIKKTVTKLIDGLNDSSKRFLLRLNGEYAGIVRIRKTKYDNYKECGELGALYLLDCAKGKGFGKILFCKAVEELKKIEFKRMILGCLSGNPSNEFYKHMGGEFIDTNPLTLPNGQKLMENLYLYHI